MYVNLSSRQFRHPRLAQNVARTLLETELEPSTLGLEITESSIVEDTPSTVTMLRQLKQLGTKLVIDDFGTGYSSLSYLKRLPVDFLKIDRSFVDRLGEDSRDKKIVSAIVGLAHALNLKVVAEGVENVGQLAQLRELESDLAQGYHFSKPLPGESASALLASNVRG
jgi:EAL domain-containing protein (putative c-di-GMP-specific phosphodiesterase class I)